MAGNSVAALTSCDVAFSTVNYFVLYSSYADVGGVFVNRLAWKLMNTAGWVEPTETILP
jgi:hypothetical protein